MKSDAVSTLLTLWLDAQERGWLLNGDQATGYWEAHDPEHLVGMSYQPPTDMTSGVVITFDADRTATWTGVANAIEATELIRAFLGWPDLRGIEPVPCH